MNWTQNTNTLTSVGGKINYKIIKYPDGSAFVVRYGLESTTLPSQKLAIKFCEKYDKDLGNG